MPQARFGTDAANSRVSLAAPCSMPAVPQTPVTQNPEKVEEKKNSFMGRLLGVGA